MVAADNDRCRDLALLDQVVEHRSGLVSFAIAEPADAGRQALKRNPLLGQFDPAVQVLVLREELENRLIGAIDIFRVTRKRYPPKRTFALAEQRANIRRDKAWESKRSRITTLASFIANRVSVIKNHGTLIHETDHGFDVLRHRSFGALGEFLRHLLGILASVAQLDTFGNVIERVVRRSLVGHDVDWNFAF